MFAANPEKLKVVKEIGRREAVFAMARVPGSRRLYFGGSDFAVHEIDLDEEKPEAKELGRHESYVTGLALAGAGATLVSGSYDGHLIWWNTASRSQVRSVSAHGKWIRNVVATPDGRTIASVADDMICRLWDAETGQLIRALKGHEEKTPHHFPSMLYACAVSADSRYVATGDKVGLVNVWEIESGKKLASVEAPVMYTWDPVQRRHSIGGIRSLAFSPDGTRIAAGGIGTIGNIDHLDGKARIEVFDWQKGERTHELASDTYKGLVEHLQFHPGGDWLLAAGGSESGFLIVFDLAGKKVIGHEKMPMHVHKLAAGDDPETLFAVGDKKLAILSMAE